MSLLASLLQDLPEPDAAARDAVAGRAAQVIRPAGALRRLDDVASWVAAWRASTAPSVDAPAAVVFAADHGVAAAGVSAYPVEVTAAMLAAFRAGRSSVDAIARTVGARVVAVDVGVGRPTGDLRVEPALDPERFDAAVAAGRDAVAALDADLVVLGEMGIGNTTAAAAVVACCLGGEASTWVGRGTGVDGEALRTKVAAVQAAQERLGGTSPPLEVLRQAGGAELAAIAGATLEARRRRLPVVLDGYVVTAAVLPLHLARAGALDHCLAGHCSAEPGHRRLLEHLGLAPLLDLDLRLGEASGGLAAVPLVQMACRLVTDVPTFDEWFG